MWRVGILYKRNLFQPERKFAYLYQSCIASKFAESGMSMLLFHRFYQTRGKPSRRLQRERMHQARKSSLRPRRWPQVLQSRGRRLKPLSMAMKTLTSLSPGLCGFAAGAAPLALADEGAVGRAAYSSSRAGWGWPPRCLILPHGRSRVVRNVVGCPARREGAKRATEAKESRWRIAPPRSQPMFLDAGHGGCRGEEFRINCD